MNISEKGLALIKNFEGLRLDAYQCSASVWSIGYGHTRGVMPGDSITEYEAEDLLLQDIRETEQSVHRLVSVKLAQNQFDALVSFTFNLGAGALQRSTLLKRLNAGDYHAAAAEFPRWAYAGGVRLSGLLRRRTAEKALFEQTAQDLANALNRPVVGYSNRSVYTAYQDGHEKLFLMESKSPLHWESPLLTIKEEPHWFSLANLFGETVKARPKTFFPNR